MNLESKIVMWTREAIAHGYDGFLVVEKENKEIDRIFLNTSTDGFMEIGHLKVLQEVYFDISRN